jgi:RHS repeat-associated protein
VSAFLLPICDAANRLTSVTSGTLTTTFEYDGLGNRTAQTVNDVTTEYVLDVAGGLPEVIVATTSGASTRYVQVQGQILGQQESGAWVYILPDHLGSVRQLVGSGSQVDLAQSFDPFGVLFESSGSGESAFGYTGEWYGSYNELLFLRARYYDPVVGRFLTEDTKPGVAYLPKSLHVYVYAWNNPILLTDPSGLQPPPPECEDLGQICYTGTTGPQVTQAGNYVQYTALSELVPASPTEPMAYSERNDLPDGFLVGRMVNVTGGLPYANLIPCPIENERIFNVMAFGEETVYDFVHRQKQKFDVLYYGIDIAQLYGLEINRYEGLATGFREVDSVNDYSGLSIVQASPVGLSFSIALVEVGEGTSFSRSVTRPGVDTVTIGFSVEIGLGIPGPLLEEGASGAYWGLAGAQPQNPEAERISDLATLEGEIRRSTWIVTEIAVTAARYWWWVGE